MILVAFYSIVVVLGILSMGFQLLGSRLLNPHFGSDVLVWAWLISTFLAAFSAGSMLGGWISKLTPPPRFRGQLIVAALGLVSLALTTFFSRPILDALEVNILNRNLGLFVACVGLFFFPVMALSTFGPQCVGFLATRGMAPGAASGLIYGISTVGNIAGVMLTALVLIPHFRVSRLMIGWLVVAIVGLVCLIAILRSASPRSSSQP